MRLLTLLLLPLVLASCARGVTPESESAAAAGDEGGDTLSDPSGHDGVECALDTDCQAGLKCIHGACFTREQASAEFGGTQDACASATDCPAGYGCVDGACELPRNPSDDGVGPGVCAADLDCPGDRVCLDGACVAPESGGGTFDPYTDGCTEDGQCNDGDVCLNGQCGPPGTTPQEPDGRCDDNWDCDWGHVCVGEVCQENQRGGDCEQNWDCLWGETCIYNICDQPESGGGCDDPFDCPLGDVCTQGVCTTPDDECGC